jgi:bifunctional DNase/RNase
MVQTAGPLGAGVQTGYFLLMRVAGQGSEMIEDADRALVMSVGGDTLTGVAQLAQGLQTGAAGGRPLSLDLLWQVLQRGQEISKRTWNVLRVAVVELRGNTFVGRIFFGDPATGQVAWDCDCRPSDACWLALKSQAPIYIHRTVWEDSAMLLRDIQRSAEEQQQAAQDMKARRRAREAALEQGRAVGTSGAVELGEMTPQTIMTTPRDADPEPLKRLKMEMRVALHEEDYAAAARIRDHPWMRLHLGMLQAIQVGDMEEADRCEQKLQAAINQHEEEERRQNRAHHERGGRGGGWSDGPSYRQFY